MSFLPPKYFNSLNSPNVSIIHHVGVNLTRQTKVSGTYCSNKILSFGKEFKYVLSPVENRSGPRVY